MLPTDSNAEVRLAAIEAAQRLQNVAEACRLYCISRTQFYEFKRRYKLYGIRGLYDRPPVAKSHPLKISVDVVEQIKAVALLHSDAGYHKIKKYLNVAGISVSAISIQKYLSQENLSTQHDRWLALEARHAENPSTLTCEQMAFLKTHNPCHREAQAGMLAPGNTLQQDAIYMGHFERLGRLYLHVAIDVHSGYAFGLLYTSRRSEVAVALLHRQVLPFMKANSLSIKRIHTDHGREFRGGQDHPYQHYLQRNYIKHDGGDMSPVRPGGCIERFREIVFDEFVEAYVTATGTQRISVLHAAFDEWLTYYNEVRPLKGYPTRGATPISVLLP